MDKSPEAFRTISEVAESLETPAHVLRFWESRFPQIRPVKRAGGRRYYRPADVALLSGIRHLLHDEGMTIRGVQKILRELGVRHVAAMAAGGDAGAFEADVLEGEGQADEGAPQAAESTTAEVYDLEPAKRTALTPDGALGEVVSLRTPTRPLVEVEARQQVPPPPPPPKAPELTEEEVPEAGHIWVDDEPELDLSVPASLYAEPPASEPHAAPEPADDAGLMEHIPLAEPMLSGIAARLRALPRPVSAEALPELMELHSRLGLLQAQMAEALRQRR
jgi:DNA-binding transcriptional MerR regulator